MLFRTAAARYYNDVWEGTKAFDSTVTKWPWVRQGSVTRGPRDLEGERVSRSEKAKERVKCSRDRERHLRAARSSSMPSRASESCLYVDARCTSHDEAYENS